MGWKQFTYLEEEYKRHPLIIAVVRFFGIIITQTTLCHFGANMFALDWKEKNCV